MKNWNFTNDGACRFKSEKIAYYGSIGAILSGLTRISHRYCSIFEQSVALDCSKDSEEKVCKPCRGGLFEQDDVTDAQICPVSYEKCGLKWNVLVIPGLDLFDIASKA